MIASRNHQKLLSLQNDFGKKQEILYRMACLDTRGHMFLSKKTIPACFSKICCKGQKDGKGKKMERKQEGSQKGERNKDMFKYSTPKGSKGTLFSFLGLFHFFVRSPLVKILLFP